MNYLQKVRRILQILKLLHVPFAAKLDRIIGQIQSAVLGPFLMVLRWLNGYGYWINAIVTTHYTIHKPLFMRTMQAYQGDWINLWWTAQTRAAAGSSAPPAVATGAPPSGAAELADFRQYAADGTGAYSGYVARARQIVQQAAAGV
jgi:hypothetical protein